MATATIGVVGQRSKPCLCVFINFWGQVVLDVAGIFNGVFNNNRNVRAHAQDNRVGERCGLCEKVEVPQGKVKLHGLLHVNVDLLFLLGCVVGSGENVASAQIPTDRESDPLFCARNRASVTHYLQVPNDALEFTGWHLNSALVGSIRDSELFIVDIHEFQFCSTTRIREFLLSCDKTKRIRPIRVTTHTLCKLRTKVGNAVLFGALKHEGESVCILVALECDNVVVAGTFEDLAEINRVETETDRTIASIVIQTCR